MKRLILIVVVIICAYLAYPASSQDPGKKRPKTPIAMERLKHDLSYVRGESPSGEGWPRVIQYTNEIYDFRKDVFNREERVFEMQRKPLRIIPHSVGVTEILWAICPRERIIAFNNVATDPDFCLIADLVKERGPIFKLNHPELVIGFQPDLVFTVFYSDATFKTQLRKAKVPFFDLGYFGTVESIKKQTLLIGRIIGEEGNAEALVEIMDEKIQELKGKLPETDKATRLLFYDKGGYIPGTSSNFNSICNIIEAVNVGSEQGIKSWKQIDFETLLKWDPDVIIVPQGSNLKEQLTANAVLSHARAIKNNRVHYIPSVYLSIDSQYLIVSANQLAGIVYEKAF